MIERPGSSSVWRQATDPSAAFACGQVHSGPGRLDESTRRLSHEELTVAQQLAAEGHQVRSVAESRRGGRHPDLDVCGAGVEIKSFAPAAERRRAPTPQGVFNKLVDAAGQADHVVLVGTGSGLSPATAPQGLARYAADIRPLPALHSLRVLGDGYDLAWSTGPPRETVRRPQPERRPAAAEVGL